MITLKWTAKKILIAAEMVMDTAGENLYLTHNYGVSRISMATWER